MLRTRSTLSFEKGSSPKELPKGSFYKKPFK